MGLTDTGLQVARILKTIFFQIYHTLKLLDLADLCSNGNELRYTGFFVADERAAVLPFGG